METNLNSVQSLFESFIALYQSVFGFLPNWTLLFMHTAILFSIGLFLYKLIRG